MEANQVDLDQAVKQEVVAEVETRIPTVGRIVLYKVPLLLTGCVPQSIYDNGVRAGDLLPAVIVRAWETTPDAAVNLRVFCDGPHDAWITSVLRGSTTGSWQWPPRS